MKKLTLMILSVMLLMACAGPKTVQESKKVIKGYWTLDTITYSETGTFTVTVFNDTSRECFQGSKWRFIPNNNSGVYTIIDGNCPTGERDFIFAIQEMDKETGLYDFLVKANRSETQVGRQ